MGFTADGKFEHSFFKFSWVQEQWKNNRYRDVQNTFDVPYDNAPAPSKIPGAAIEFNSKSLGKVTSARLAVSDAISHVSWESGVTFNSFVHATDQVGWFRFKGLKSEIVPILIPPAYQVEDDSTSVASISRQDLRRLGYKKGNVEVKDNSITYTQEGFNGFSYDVHVSWVQNGDVLEGSWSITSSLSESHLTAKELVEEKMKLGYSDSFRTHKQWWRQYWQKSSIQIPDSILEKQWYLEQYKFGSVARDGTPPVSLQAVWTADNGKLPPWKGDFHHDLNTQLSYWASYSGNHLDLENGYLQWMLKNKDTFKKYTQDYFESDGLAVPGVTTLTGEPMGGWIQYAFGPTVSGWLGLHFYWHWRFSMDEVFLKDKAYPWIKDVAVFFDEISVKDENGLRKLPISSSPEIHDNSRNAWFGETTNFDLAAIRWTYEKATELATHLGKTQEAEKWNKLLGEWPNFAIHSSEGLMLAPEHSYTSSHRHFSHLMAFHPYALIDYSKGDAHKTIIDNTVNHLIEKGSDYWTGYSFSWLGNLQARIFDGEGAAKTLRIFAENFCLPNSFHVNGEQHNKGYSKFKYRPFTLEGNFAFAAAIQEMLLQSHTRVIHVFPAIPSTWEDVSFTSLRGDGAFLISAKMEKGNVTHVEIISEKGGELKLRNPFRNHNFKCSSAFTVQDDILHIPTTEGQNILLSMDNK